MKKNKKVLFATTLFSLSIIPVAAVSIVKSINLTEQDITKKSEDTQAITNPVVSNVSFQLKKDYQSLSWYNKQFSNAVTEAQLKELLLPNYKYGVNYGILIETPTEKNGDLTNGYVKFAIYIRNNKIDNGVPTVDDANTSKFTFVAPPSDIFYDDGVTKTGIDMRAYTNNSIEKLDTPDTINGIEIERKNIWTTEKISNLFLPYKYSFSWNSNDKIGDFLQETSKQPPTSSVSKDDSDTYLTAQDVYNNMIATASQTDLLPDDTIEKAISVSTTTDSLSKYGISQDNALKYGIALVTVDFTKSTSGNLANSWADGSIPNKTYLVRGLDNSSGDKEEMKINLQVNSNSFLNTTFDISKIKNQNHNFTAPKGVTGNTVKIRDFTPTQLINALVTNQNGTSNLLDLLTSKNYLSQTTDLPAIYLSYMGSNQFTSSTSDNGSAKAGVSSWGGTGLNEQGKIFSKTNGKLSNEADQNAASASTITAINASSNDSTGTLYLKVTYNKYNVYENVEEMGLTTSFVISGMKTTSSTATDDLYLQWKTVDQLIFNNAAYVTDLYTKYKSDSSYCKSLSNAFF